MKSCAQCAGERRPFLTCSICKRVFHSHCVDSGNVPGGLVGDVFFDYTCSTCSYWKTEEFCRQKLSWKNILVLTLYNLQQRSGGLSLRGYFHWKMHICAFIDKHWDTLFGQHSVKRKKNWHGTVAGTLSHFSPQYFCSGSEVLKEAGWWRLTHSLESQSIIEIHLRKGQKRPGDAINIDERRVKKFSFLPEAGPSFLTSECEKSETYVKEITEHAASEIKEEIIFMSADNFAHEEQINTEDTEEIKLECATLEESENDNCILGSEIGDIPDSDEDSLEYLTHMIPDLNEEDNVDLTFDFCFEDIGKEECTEQHDAESKTEKENLSESESEAKSDTEDDKSKSENEFKPLPTLFKVNHEQPIVKSDTDGGDESICGWESDCEDDTYVNLSSDNFSSTEEAEDDFVLMEDEEEAVAKDGDSKIQLELQNVDKNVCTLELESIAVNSENLKSREELPVEKESDCRKEKQNTVTDNEKQLPEKMIQNTEDKEIKRKMRFISPYDELVLLKRLQNIIQKKSDVPSYIYRYYRKLYVRQQKRSKRVPLFDLDRYIKTKDSERYLERDISLRGILHNNEIRILDRYQTSSATAPASLPTKESFLFELVGHSELKAIYSPYTKRMIKPYIHQDWDARPFWLRFLQELDAAANKKNRSWEPLQLYPINYCYMQNEHIPVVNALCHKHFYPGIDVTECLHYPEFTCVALYKKLVIGFAIMVPDASITEAYISFIFTRAEWRKAGIATFMLYHLLQASQEKDVTLHVSVKNSAMILYQKFGFKIQKFEYNFYDRYLPWDTKECRHALFLRFEK